MSRGIQPVVYRTRRVVKRARPDADRWAELHEQRHMPEREPNARCPLCIAERAELAKPGRRILLHVQEVAALEQFVHAVAGADPRTPTYHERVQLLTRFLSDVLGGGE